MPADLRRSGEAALCLALAREIDNPKNSATSKSMCAGQLRDALADLRARMPAAPESDEVDDIAARGPARLVVAT
jgi:hypothetical protein